MLVDCAVMYEDVKRRRREIMTSLADAILLFFLLFLGFDGLSLEVEFIKGTDSK